MADEPQTDKQDPKAEAQRMARRESWQMSERGLKLDTLRDALEFCQAFVASKLAAEDDTAQSVLMKLEMGRELGLPPMAALQQVVVVKGRLTLQGAGMLALIRASRVGTMMVYDEVDANGEMLGVAEGERDGHKYRVTFTQAQAVQAQLWERKSQRGHEGPWSYYKADMLIWKAVARAAKRYFPDIIMGMEVTETAVEEPALERERAAAVVVAPASLSAAGIRSAAVVEAVDDAPAGSSADPIPTQTAATAVVEVEAQPEPVQAASEPLAAQEPDPVTVPADRMGLVGDLADDDASEADDVERGVFG